MKVVSYGVFVVLLAIASSFGGDDVVMMKASMDSMKEEMEAMRAHMAAEKKEMEAMRASMAAEKKEMEAMRASMAAEKKKMEIIRSNIAAEKMKMETIHSKMATKEIEMQAMSASLLAEREALRATAGGAPDGLSSAKGNATIRIGGDVRVQYQIGSGNGYGRQGYTAWGEYTPYDPDAHGEPDPGYAVAGNSNYRSAKAGWSIARAEIDFDIDFSCDTKGFVSLRFDENGSLRYVKQLNGQSAANILDQAYWQWNNVGGSGLEVKVGLMNMPFGMTYNTDMGGYDFDGVDRPLITDPFVRRISNLGFIDLGVTGALPVIAHYEVANLGLQASYRWDDQLTLKAGIMAGGLNNATLSASDSLTYDNQIRNIGLVDHVVALGWNPCWLEGLHLETSYMGTFDAGMGGQFSWKAPNFIPGGFRPPMRAWGRLGSTVNNNPYAHDYTFSMHGDSSYRPSLDLGVSYKINDQWKVYAEGNMTWNPSYVDGFGMTLTAGVDYRMTEKIMFGFGVDWAHLRQTGDIGYFVTPDGILTGNMSHPDVPFSDITANLYRINVGAKYDFGNGIYVQAQYYHDMVYFSGIGVQDMKDADTILFQTGYQF